MSGRDADKSRTFREMETLSAATKQGERWGVLLPVDENHLLASLVKLCSPSFLASTLVLRSFYTTECCINRQRMELPPSDIRIRRNESNVEYVER